jgi:hypothetical protein
MAQFTLHVCGKIRGPSLDEVRLLIAASCPDELPETSPLLHPDSDIARTCLPWLSGEEMMNRFAHRLPIGSLSPHRGRGLG